MILKRILFSLSQRRLWSAFKRKRSEWPEKKSGKQHLIIPIGKKSKIKLNTSNKLSEYIYCGAFEWAERQYFNERISKKDIVYDIGANIGYLTILLAEKGARVLAFEPVTATYLLLNENRSLNPHLPIECYQNALSSEKGSGKILVSNSGRDAWNSMVLSTSESGEFTTEEIQTVSLDFLIEEKKFPVPTFLKIDVEGWEMEVLKGAEGTLRKHAPEIMIEFTSENLRAAGTSNEGLAQIIRSYGYTLYEYHPSLKKLIEVKSFDFDHKNLIARK